MAGKPGRSGGPRPGSGRKPVAVENRQRENRNLILTLATAEDVQIIFNTAMAGAQNGNADDRKWLTPFLFGNPELTVKHQGDEDHPFRIFVESVRDRA